MSVFLPERLELVKGAPAARRAHLDQLVAALWPSRAGTRAAYSRALAQRNALLARVRAGAAPVDGLGAWDRELAAPGPAADGGSPRGRGRHRGRVRGAGGAARASRRGRAALPAALPGGHAGRARARSSRSAAPRDIERGFTVHGPHRDEIQLLLDGVGAALLRIPGPAARRPARAAVRRARAARRAPRPGAADAARRRDVGARRRSPRAAGGAAALRRPGAGDRHRARRHVPGAESTAVEVEGGRILGPSGALAA